MSDFQERFGEGNGSRTFGNIRSGLIVGLVSLSIQNGNRFN